VSSPLLRALTFAVLLLVVHEVGRRALDAFGIAAALLASGGGALGAVLILALLLVRLLLYFIVPGFVVGTLALALARLPRNRDRN
jgi:hypothetical protein